MTEEWVDIARAGEYDDIPIYARADGSRARVYEGLVAPDPDDTNLWLDLSSSPPRLMRYDADLEAWTQVASAPGEQVDAHYVHDQQVAVTSVEIEHGLNKYPAVTLVDTANTVVEGEVTYLNEHRVRVEFDVLVSFKAYFS